MRPASEHQRWLDAMLAVARHYGVGVSEENVSAALRWESHAPDDTLLQRMAAQLGLALRFSEFSDELLSPWRLPCAVECTDGQICVVQTSDGHGRLSVLLSGDLGLQTTLPVTDLHARARRVAILRPRTSVPDARVDDYIKPFEADWFWKISLRDWPRYGDVIIASFVANLLALSAMLFSMQVYDRVIPAQSEPTLWVLFLGVMLAILFEFALRVARTHISDVVGRRADLTISDLLFGRALRLRMAARSRSTGTFIAQLREMDQLRELLASTTISALADLPFFLLFLFALWLVAGPMAYVVLGAIPALLVPVLLIQRPLASLARQGMREAALRNAMLVESVQGIEDIKLLRAEPRFQGLWNNVNEVSANLNVRQRLLTSMLVVWTQEVQSIVYAVVLLAGSVLVMRGEMTTGTLVGASILASRMLAPLAQFAGLLARWQHARIARVGLDEIMKRPVDQPEHGRLIHRPTLLGSYDLEGVRFRYDSGDRQLALTVQRLAIQAGEKVAILGRVGAGKSTLLQLLAGLQVPTEGRVCLDGIDLSIIDPADVRRDMSLLTQHARLFHGTIRENIIMGMPHASDDMVEKALAMAGALSFVRSRHEGLDNLLLEGGVGLSDGQRQALVLARMLIRDSAIVLLDEPTTSFDEATERQVIDSIGEWLGARTLVVATHRSAVLRLADRIIVLDQGRVAMDGAREMVLRELAR